MLDYRENGILKVLEVAFSRQTMAKEYVTHK